jgi:hypothetical protein
MIYLLIMVDFNTKLRTALRERTINEQVELFNGGFKLETGLKTKDTFLFKCIRNFVYAYDIAILALDGNNGYLGKSSI